MSNLIRCAAFAATVCCASNAPAAIVVQWDFASDTGNAEFKPSTGSAANVSGVDFQRGPGLQAEFNPGTFNSKGWEFSDAPLNYVEFGFQVSAGHSVQLDNLQIGTVGSGFSPGTMGLFFSGDGYANPLHTFTQPFSVPVYNELDLTGLGPLTGETRFRLMQMGPMSSFPMVPTDDFAFLAVENFRGAPVAFNGTVYSAIPEPSAIMTLCLVGSCFVMRRSRRPSGGPFHECK